MRIVRCWITVLTFGLMVGCSSPQKEADAPAPTAEPKAEAEPSGDALHAALVETHRKAVGECFGGFGKGAPYAVEMTISGSSVSEATAAPLSEDTHGQLPSDCIAKHFRAMEVPSSVSSANVKARFAVKNDSCTVATCPETDLPCNFKRDIACSVVVDSR